jgi:hypothetical protein
MGVHENIHSTIKSFSGSILHYSPPEMGDVDAGSKWKGAWACDGGANLWLNTRGSGLVGCATTGGAVAICGDDGDEGVGHSGMSSKGGTLGCHRVDYIAENASFASE